MMSEGQDQPFAARLRGKNFKPDATNSLPGGFSPRLPPDPPTRIHYAGELPVLGQNITASCESFSAAHNDCWNRLTLD